MLSNLQCSHCGLVCTVSLHHAPHSYRSQHYIINHQQIILITFSLVYRSLPLSCTLHHQFALFLMFESPVVVVNLDKPLQCAKELITVYCLEINSVASPKNEWMKQWCILLLRIERHSVALSPHSGAILGLWSTLQVLQILPTVQRQLLLGFFILCKANHLL